MLCADTRSPHLYTPDEAPHYTRGLSSNLALFVAIIILVGLGVGYVRILNAKHAATRVQVGKSAKVIDLSMENKRTLVAQNETVNDGAEAGGVGQLAFDDITDLKNEDFIYVY